MPKDDLLILPFDHRSSFSKDILGIKGEPNIAEKKKIMELKSVVYAGVKLAMKKSKYSDSMGILVDEEYGRKIAIDAKKKKIPLAMPVEKSGQSELRFEYEDDYKKHIEKFKPDYVKVLVRYNPLNRIVNLNQIIRLRKLSKFCQKNDHKLMFELLVPPTERDLRICGNKEKYDQKLRLNRTLLALRQLNNILKVDIWKLEGFVAGWQSIIQILGRDSKIIVLGRGENKKQVKTWLDSAKKHKQLIGFAIGRTNFLEPLCKLVNKEMNKTQTVENIAKNYLEFVNYWYK